MTKDPTPWSRGSWVRSFLRLELGGHGLSVPRVRAGTQLLGKALLLGDALSLAASVSFACVPMSYTSRARPVRTGCSGDICRRMKQKADVGKVKGNSKTANAWEAVRRTLGESGTLSTAINVLRDQGFSAVTIRAAPAWVLARALTAAEDELEMRRQSDSVTQWRRLLRDVRRELE